MAKDVYSAKDFSVATLNSNAMDRVSKFQNLIDELGKNEHHIYWLEAASAVKPRMKIKKRGCVSHTDVISFVSNDYLGMSQNAQTIEAGIEALKKYGTGVCAAPIIGGFLDIHRELELKIADFTGQEDAILFTSGFGANTGTLNALLGKDDIALFDTFVHTSVLDGLKGTNKKNIGHNDLDYLELTLKREQDNYKTKMVVIDGVYSQDGDLAMLPEIKHICEKYNAILFVDDAHGIGVFGNNGRGAVEYFNMLGNVDIISGTFSKAFGAVGGFVCGSKPLIQYLKHYVNTSVFSAALTPQVTASVSKAIDIITQNPDFRKKLWDNVSYMREKLTVANIDFGKTESPIFPIMVRDSYKVKEFTKLLQEKGVYTVGIVFPAVSDKQARIRVSLSASHSKEDIDSLVNSLCEVKQMLLI